MERTMTTSKMIFKNVELSEGHHVPMTNERGFQSTLSYFDKNRAVEVHAHGNVCELHRLSPSGDLGPVCALFPMAHVKRAELISELETGAKVTSLQNVTTSAQIREPVQRASALGSRSFFASTDGYSVSLVERVSGSPLICIERGGVILVLPFETCVSAVPNPAAATAVAPTPKRAAKAA
jgi:hypothetical protein